MVSRADCASIDGLRCNEMSQTIRHLSVLTGSTYMKDQHGNILRDEKFEETLRNAIPSVSKLRTLVLLGQYDYSFLQVFQHIFKQAHNLRLLHMSARSANFLKRGSHEVDGVFPQVLSKLYHLQVLDVSSYIDPTMPDGINDLVSLRHLIVHKGLYSSIGTIDKVASFQEPHGFMFQISSSFEITKPESTELVQHCVHVKTLEEAYEAGLTNNELSEKLHLSWKDSSAVLVMEHLGLEPHWDLKVLHISGYCRATSSDELDNNISVTSFETPHLYDCGEWKILPSLQRFPFLTKLKLSNLPKLIEVLAPSLEELILVQMPKFERCSCTSVDVMNSRLRALQFEDCKALKEFDLFGNDDKFKIEPRSWLPGLRKLLLRDCPQLEVLKPLPPSTSCSELLISDVSILPYMEGSCSEELHIGYIDEDELKDFDESSDELRIIDYKILAFHNLRNLISMNIYGCRNLSSFSFEGFSHLVLLESLEIYMCEELFSSYGMPHITLEAVTPGNYRAFPSLGRLSIESCGITGNWLSLILGHAPDLEELSLNKCPHITTILLPSEEEENSLSIQSSTTEYSSLGYPDDPLTGLARADDPLTRLDRDGLLYIASNLVSSLKKLTIWNCPRLTFNGSKESLSRFTSLEKLDIWGCSRLLSSLVHKDGSDGANRRWLLPSSLTELKINSFSQETLQPCFPRDITGLKKLDVSSSPGLESLQLQSCMALEELMIQGCESLTALEDLQFVRKLRHLRVFNCPSLVHKDGNGDQANGRWLLPKSLKALEISVYSQETLQPFFPKYITSLKRLEVRNSQGLQSLQLHSCTALEELEIEHCGSLATLEGLKSLGRLTCLTVFKCPGLPPCLESFSSQGYKLCCRLETLTIDDPSVLTTSFCNHLTSLQRLELTMSLGRVANVTRLTDEQERALVLLKSLQELHFSHLSDLVDLPEGLRTLPFLKRLNMFFCWGLTRLPVTGLPLSLEQLEIRHCGRELADECRLLATTKLKVRIDHRDVN